MAEYTPTEDYMCCSPSPDLLTQLPAEVKLRVFCNVPRAETHSMQLVCRHMKHFLRQQNSRLQRGQIHELLFETDRSGNRCCYTLLTQAGRPPKRYLIRGDDDSKDEFQISDYDSHVCDFGGQHSQLADGALQCLVEEDSFSTSLGHLIHRIAHHHLEIFTITANLDSQRLEELTVSLAESSSTFDKARMIGCRIEGSFHEFQCLLQAIKSSEIEILETEFPEFTHADFEQLLKCDEIKSCYSLALANIPGLSFDNATFTCFTAHFKSLALSPVDHVPVAGIQQVLQAWKHGTHKVQRMRFGFSTELPWDVVDITRNLGYEGMEIFFGGTIDDLRRRVALRNVNGQRALVLIYGNAVEFVAETKLSN